ncbi:MAG: hypothetical protein D3916_14320, partial [Candidatus Electrothrix sp. MAN1_4]|nr:hypothetical protein [Candidatus Electrothrix sp. MAN1_4]
MSQNQQQDCIAHRISQALQISSQQVAATAQLLEEGATVPFISRHKTGHDSGKPRCTTYFPLYQNKV